MRWKDEIEAHPERDRIIEAFKARKGKQPPTKVGGFKRQDAENN